MTTSPAPAACPPAWAAGSGKKPNWNSRVCAGLTRLCVATSTPVTVRPRSSTSRSRGSSVARMSGITSHRLRPASASSARSLMVESARLRCCTRSAGSRKPRPTGALSSTLPSSAVLARSARRRRMASRTMVANDARTAAMDTACNARVRADACRSAASIRPRARPCILATEARTASIDALSCPVRIRARAASGPWDRRASTTRRANSRLVCTSRISSLFACSSMPTAATAASSDAFALSYGSR